MHRTQKAKLVETLQQTFNEAELVIVTQSNGLTVAEVTDLRQKMRQSQAGYKVTKNRLAKIATKGTKFEGLNALFTGPTAIAWSRDPVSAAKVTVTYANANEKIKIVGAAMGDRMLGPKEVDALAKLPSLDELRGKIIGLLQAPASKIARVLKEPGGQLARVVNAYASKGSA